MVDVACSDTESVSMLVVIKRGFAALRYLKDGKVTISMPEETIAIPAIMVPLKSARPLRNCTFFNITLIMTYATRNPVHPIMKSAFRLSKSPAKVSTGNPIAFNKSNSIVTKTSVDVKITEVNTMNLLSFLRNGNAKKKSPIGNMKNWMPPHEVRPRPERYHFLQSLR